MCIALPAKIIERKGTIAVVESFGGKVREIDCTFLPEAEVNMYLLAYGGRALKVMDEQDAKELIELLRQVQGRGRLFEIIQKGKLNKDDIKYLLTLEDAEDLRLLYSEADRLREVFLKKTVCVHGVIEFSNHCESKCAYCGLSSLNTSLNRYRMEKDEIIALAHDAVDSLGFKMIVLQSGEDPYYSDDMICEIIREIKKGKPALVFLSIGERNFEAYKRFRKAGAKGALFRFETSDPVLYKKLHPDSSLETRIEHIKFMKELGYLVASGPLVGLPGQTIDSLADDILLMRNLKIDMASLGPFIPHEATPLAHVSPGTVELSKRVIAATRMALSPNMRIPIATSLETIGGGDARKSVLTTGANSLMLNLTPQKYSRDYAIYPGKFEAGVKVNDAVVRAQKVVKSLGRRVCKGWGVKLKVQEKSDEFLPVCE